MDKKLIYAGFWDYELVEVVAALKVAGKEELASRLQELLVNK